MQVLLNREVRSTQYSYTPNARDVACQCSPRPTPALRAVVLWGKRLLDVTQHPPQIRNGGWGMDTRPLEGRGPQREVLGTSLVLCSSRRVSLFRVLGSGSFEPHLGLLQPVVLQSTPVAHLPPTDRSPGGAKKRANGLCSLVSAALRRR
jgi:hypothetical protein